MQVVGTRRVRDIKVDLCVCVCVCVQTTALQKTGPTHDTSNKQDSQFTYNVILSNVS